MKKWLYLIIPAIMLGLFLFIYFPHVEKTHKKEEDRKAAVAKKKAEDDEKKKVAEAKARDDAKKRQDERDAEDAKKQKEKEDKQAADDKKVRDQTAEYTAKANAASAEVQKLEGELDRMRKEKDRLSRETFDLAKQVELARIARRNAELETQRITDMLAKRAADSSLTRMPAIPTPPPAKS